MTEIQGKSILVRVSEGSSHRESTVTVYIARAEYSLIPDDAVDQRKLGF